MTSGYASMTMDQVARRAGTSKPVIYRRWHNRVDLVIAAMRQHVPTLSAEAPDTGSLRGDVLALLQRVVRLTDQVGQGTLRGLLADYYQMTDSVSLWPHSLGLGTSAMMTILRRAAERGEVNLESVTPRIASLPLDLTRHEVLVNRALVADAALSEIVDDIFLPLVSRD